MVTEIMGVPEVDASVLPTYAEQPVNPSNDARPAANIRKVRPRLREDRSLNS
jgi:hypothetical protein